MFLCVDEFSAIRSFRFIKEMHYKIELRAISFSSQALTSSGIFFWYAKHDTINWTTTKHFARNEEQDTRKKRNDRIMWRNNTFLHLSLSHSSHLCLLFLKLHREHEVSASSMHHTHTIPRLLNVELRRDFFSFRCGCCCCQTDDGGTIFFTIHPR